MDLWPLMEWMCSVGGITGETEKVPLGLLSARLNDDVEEFMREAQRGLGERLLEKSPRTG